MTGSSHSMLTTCGRAPRRPAARPGPPPGQVGQQRLAVGRAAQGGRHPADIAPDVVQPLGVQAHHPDVAAGQPVDGRAHAAVGHGADLAQVLGDDQLRAQLGQQVEVQVVDGQGGAQQLPHRPVQLAAGPGPLEPGAGDGRQLGHLGWVVALVGDADQLLAGPEGADDLGGRRQQ
jgi:hypothetical protein